MRSARAPLGLLLLLLLLLPACANAPSTAPPPPPSPSALADALCVPVEVVFDPPLDVPTMLLVEHEAAVGLRVEAARSGVTLRLPPGPVVLRLTIDGAADERAFVVAPEGSVCVWHR